MRTYSAYTIVDESFTSFEEAVAYLSSQPGSAERSPTAVTLLTGSSHEGAVGREVDGVFMDPSAVQAYQVQVAHSVMGNIFYINYVVEFSNIEEDEGGEGERDSGDEAESHPGYEEVIEQPVEEDWKLDNGDEQPGDSSEPGTEVVLWNPDVWGDTGVSGDERSSDSETP